MLQSCVLSCDRRVSSLLRGWRRLSVFLSFCVDFLLFPTSSVTVILLGFFFSCGSPSTNLCVRAFRVINSFSYGFWVGGFLFPASVLPTSSSLVGELLLTDGVGLKMEPEFFLRYLDDRLLVFGGIVF